jgi:hypothetical protein
MLGGFEELPQPFKSSDVQFLFAGYSWIRKDFRIWTIYYSDKERRFAAREAKAFGPRLRKAAFIGDWAKKVRTNLVRELAEGKGPAYLEPLRVLAMTLQSAEPPDTVGGPPQLVRITQHMNTRALCVRWKGKDTLFGRPLFDYENTDYWIVDPFSGRLSRPRKFGDRPGGSGDDESEEVDQARRPE